MDPNKLGTTKTDIMETKSLTTEGATALDSSSDEEVITRSSVARAASATCAHARSA